MTKRPGSGVGERIPALLSAVRARRPLVHHIANFVTMHAVANATRAIGALPVMAMALQDAEQMVGQADALVLSLGTPTPERVEAMLVAGRRAAGRGIPIVLDPVGVGATEFRGSAARRLLGDLPVTVVKSNRGEAAALLGLAGQIRGVESVAAVEHEGADALAPALARTFGVTAAITGPRDYVAGGDRLLIVENGHPWLAALPGTGCMAAAMVGVFCAVEADPVVAAAAALACFGLAAEIASGDARGPGSLLPGLLDALYHLHARQARQRARVKEHRCDSI